MIPGNSWHGFFARTLALTSSVDHQARDDRRSPEVFTSQAKIAIQTLHKHWYNVETGLWDDAWWNSGNTLTMLADFAGVATAAANEINVGGYMRHTYNEAQVARVQTTKVQDFGMKTTSTDQISRPARPKQRIGDEADDKSEHKGQLGKNTWTNLNRREFPNFINDFYDDEGWWALALLRSYDVTGDQDYLNSAATIFEDMKTGLGGPCGGGIYWSKERKYVNAIANELYLSTAAGLANRSPEGSKEREEYFEIAKEQWSWFRESGMINKDGLINDGLNGKCENNGMQTWSYNQGVILGGLVELARASGGYDSEEGKLLVARATEFAQAAIKHLSNKDGILVETDKCELREGNCGRDGQQFKGIFMRNLRYLWEAMPDGKERDEVKGFIVDQAVSNWENNRSVKGSRLGVSWAGPWVRATGMSQSAALDSIVAAIAVTK